MHRDHAKATTPMVYADDNGHVVETYPVTSKY